MFPDNSCEEWRPSVWSLEMSKSDRGRDWEQVCLTNIPPTLQVSCFSYHPWLACVGCLKFCHRTSLLGHASLCLPTRNVAGQGCNGRYLGLDLKLFISNMWDVSYNYWDYDSVFTSTKYDPISQLKWSLSIFLRIKFQIAVNKRTSVIVIENKEMLGRSANYLMLMMELP